MTSGGKLWFVGFTQVSDGFGGFVKEGNVLFSMDVTGAVVAVSGDPAHFDDVWAFEVYDFSVAPASPILGDGSANRLVGTGRGEILNGFAGNDAILAGGGPDTINGGTGDDSLLAGLGNDSVFGGAGNDTLIGGDGNDWLSGGNGTDLVNGGVGNDTLLGDSGNDILRGLAGDDQLFGGVGADRFEFALGGGLDVIADFANDIDTLQLSRALWGGGMNVQTVLATFGQFSGGIVTLDFGSDEVSIFGLSGLNDLRDDIIFVA